MTSYNQQTRIKTIEDVIEVMDKIMFGMETHQFDHQYHQVLAIHREVGAIEMRMNKVEDKLDKVLGKLDYLCATDNEKKYMYQDGTTNYDAICEMCDGIKSEMLEMRKVDAN